MDIVGPSPGACIAPLADDSQQNDDGIQMCGTTRTEHDQWPIKAIRTLYATSEIYRLDKNRTEAPVTLRLQNMATSRSSVRTCSKKSNADDYVMG